MAVRVLSISLKFVFDENDMNMMMCADRSTTRRVGDTMDTRPTA